MLRISISLTAFLIASAAFAEEECTCRHNGEDIAEGRTICMKTAKGMQYAQCVMVLNNTSWKFLGACSPVS